MVFNFKCQLRYSNSKIMYFVEKILFIIKCQKRRGLASRENSAIVLGICSWQYRVQTSSWDSVINPVEYSFTLKNQFYSSVRLCWYNFPRLLQNLIKCKNRVLMLSTDVIVGEMPTRNSRKWPFFLLFYSTISCCISSRIMEEMIKGIWKEFDM